MLTLEREFHAKILHGKDFSAFKVTKRLNPDLRNSRPCLSKSLGGNYRGNLSTTVDVTWIGTLQILISSRNGSGNGISWSIQRSSISYHIEYIIRNWYIGSLSIFFKLFKKKHFWILETDTKKSFLESYQGIIKFFTNRN